MESFGGHIPRKQLTSHRFDFLVPKYFAVSSPSDHLTFFLCTGAAAKVAVPVDEIRNKAIFALQFKGM